MKRTLKLDIGVAFGHYHEVFTVLLAGDSAKLGVIEKAISAKENTVKRVENQINTAVEDFAPDMLFIVGDEIPSATMHALSVSALARSHLVAIAVKEPTGSFVEACKNAAVLCLSTNSEPDELATTIQNRLLAARARGVRGGTVGELFSALDDSVAKKNPHPIFEYMPLRTSPIRAQTVVDERVSSLAPLRVLLVDEQEDAFAAQKSWLTSIGARVSQAKPAEAVDKRERSVFPHAVVCTETTAASGLLVKRLRTDLAFRWTSIVQVPDASLYDESSDFRRAFGAALYATAARERAFLGDNLIGGHEVRLGLDSMGPLRLLAALQSNAQPHNLIIKHQKDIFRVMVRDRAIVGAVHNSTRPETQDIEALSGLVSLVSAQVKFVDQDVLSTPGAKRPIDRALRAAIELAGPAVALVEESVDESKDKPTPQAIRTSKIDHAGKMAIPRPSLRSKKIPSSPALRTAKPQRSIDFGPTEPPGAPDMLNMGATDPSDLIDLGDDIRMAPPSVPPPAKSKSLKPAVEAPLATATESAAQEAAKLRRQKRKRRATEAFGAATDEEMDSVLAALGPQSAAPRPDATQPFDLFLKKQKAKAKVQEERKAPARQDIEDVDVNAELEEQTTEAQPKFEMEKERLEPRSPNSAGDVPARVLSSEVHQEVGFENADSTELVQPKRSRSIWVFAIIAFGVFAAAAFFVGRQWFEMQQKDAQPVADFSEPGDLQPTANAEGGEPSVNNDAAHDVDAGDEGSVERGSVERGSVEKSEEVYATLDAGEPVEEREAVVAAASDADEFVAEAAVVADVREKKEAYGTDPKKVARAAKKSAAAGDLAEAEAMYRHALTLEEDHSASLVGLAATLLRLNKASEALPFAKRAVAKRPKRAGYHALLGDCLRALGDKDGAKAAYRKALARDPDDKDAKAGLREL